VVFSATGEGITYCVRIADEGEMWLVSFDFCIVSEQ
jgi:hypothetical protein